MLLRRKSSFAHRCGAGANSNPSHKGALGGLQSLIFMLCLPYVEEETRLNHPTITKIKHHAY